MVLGALLDLGLPLDGLRAALGSLAIEYGEIATERVLRAGVSATRFLATADPATHTDEHEHAHHAHRDHDQADHDHQAKPIQAPAHAHAHDVGHHAEQSHSHGHAPG